MWWDWGSLLWCFMFCCCLMCFLSRLKGVKQHFHSCICSLTEESFFLGTPPLGLGLSGVLWNATMRKRVHGCVFACVCVWREEDYGREGKWGFAEWQLNGELKDTEGEAIFPESGRKKKKKEENVGDLVPSAKTTEERLTHLWSESRVTSLLLWDTLEVSVRSINTSVLTFPPDFLH